MSTTRKSYPSDVTDSDWEFLVSYLTLMREDAPQRAHSLRELFNALRYVVKTGCPWRFLPNDFPPWTAVYQQARRWIHGGVFEQIVHDLLVILRFIEEREDPPSAMILDGRTLQSTPECGGRAGYDGAKKKKGSKVHMAVDTLGNLLALKVTAANEQERAQPRSWRGKFKTSRADRLRSGMSTKDTMAKTPPAMPQTKVSSWKS
jgi:transposase